jgi:hypothetical protein
LPGGSLGGVDMLMLLLFDECFSESKFEDSLMIFPEQQKTNEKLN